MGAAFGVKVAPAPFAKRRRSSNNAHNALLLLLFLLRYDKNTTRCAIFAATLEASEADQPYPYKEKVGK
jgi:hypothetical protein